MHVVLEKGVMAMQYYSIFDIASAYRLTRDVLLRMIRKGKLKAQKLFMGESRTRNFKYIIPETELTKLAEYKLREPQASENAQPDYYENLQRKEKEERELLHEEAQRRAEEWRRYESYYDYLHSEEWQKKRRARLKLDGYQCQMCGSGMRLEVHHFCYDHLRKNAELDDLVTLCHDCHQKVHEYDLERRPGSGEKHNHRLYIMAAKAMRTSSMVQAWEQFNDACRRSVPPVSEREASEIWQKAMKEVYPL